MYENSWRKNQNSVSIIFTHPPSCPSGRLPSFPRRRELSQLTDPLQEIPALMEMMDYAGRAKAP